MQIIGYGHTDTKPVHWRAQLPFKDGMDIRAGYGVSSKDDYRDMQGLGREGLISNKVYHRIVTYINTYYSNDSMFKRGLSMRPLRFFGRRGISPLIATVLLIAFAVSIGTMIMNWGKDAVAVGDCSETKLEVQTINEKPLFCYDTLNNKINVMIKNVGSTDVNRLKMRVITPSFSNEDLEITDSAIKSGDIKTKNIDYTHSGKFRVEIIPVISVGGKERVCSEKYVYIDDIGTCN